MAPLISVVIPCYNQAHFLGEAIASVWQSATRDVEVVVVDDGSTDTTARVGASFAGTRLISGPNQGLAHARNRGLAESSGRFVVFLDADDMLTRGALDIGLAELSAHPTAALVSGRCRIINEDGAALHTPEQARVERDHYKELLRHNYIWMPAMAMIRRDAIERVGGFEQSAHAAADYSLYLRIARTHTVHDHGQLVALYRKHSGNMSRNSARMLQETLAVLRRERPFVAGDQDLLRAYYEGWNRWRELYGAYIVDEIRGDVRRHRWRALRNAAALGWLHPRALLRQAGHKASLTMRRATRSFSVHREDR
jgi:glycosyltransferase involved in cell wall biosynthesis